MEYFKFSLVIMLIAMTSCSDSNMVEEEKSEFIFEETRVIENYQMPEEDILNLQKLGFSGSSGVVKEKKDFISGSTYIIYLMEGDIEIRKDVLESMVEDIPEIPSLDQHKRYDFPDLMSQYHTTNLVGNNFTAIHVIGWNFDNSILHQGLQNAIQNYNDLNSQLSFTLEFRTGTTIQELHQAKTDSDILALVDASGPAGGSSGFPQGGPHDIIQIGYPTQSFGVDVATHVITHEIGHAVGLRHTDYFDRSISCSGGGNEGAGGDGAIHIPGTPAMTNVDLDSVMLACFNGSEAGEFSNYDITSLEYLYPSN